MSHWSEQFIGVPYKDKGRDFTGLDCWGVPYLHHKLVLGIEDVPSYTDNYSSVEAREEVAAAFHEFAGQWPWISILHGQHQEHDVVVFTRGGIDDHAGIVVEKSKMLHIPIGGECHITDFGPRCPRYRHPRYYRHVTTVMVELQKYQ